MGFPDLSSLGERSCYVLRGPHFVAAPHGFGFITRPRNSTVPVSLSRMRKMKGRLTVTGMGSLVGPD